MPKDVEKQNTMIVPILLNAEQYAQICAKADHDLCKPEQIIQEAVEVYLYQINGEKVILDLDVMIEAFELYISEGIDSEKLRILCEKNKFK